MCLLLKYLNNESRITFEGNLSHHRQSLAGVADGSRAIHTSCMNGRQRGSKMDKRNRVKFSKNK